MTGALAAVAPAEADADERPKHRWFANGKVDAWNEGRSYGARGTLRGTL